MDQETNRFNELLESQPAELSLLERVSRILKLASRGLESALVVEQEELDPSWFFYITSCSLYLIHEQEPQLYERMAQLKLKGLQHSILEEMLIMCAASFYPMAPIRRRNYLARLQKYCEVQAAAAEALLEEKDKQQ